MSVIRVGSTGKYADGWDHIFSGSGAANGKGSGRKKAAAKPAARKTNTGKGGGRKPSPTAKRVKPRRRK